ncbi:MAG: LCP family protein [Chloroflexi bacterium]|nr:LCP family protein [Chloroflexota bacterium]
MNLSRTTLSVLLGFGIGLICLGLTGAGLLLMSGARTLGLLPTLIPAPAFSSPGDTPPPSTTPVGEVSPGPTATPLAAAASCGGEERLNVLLLGVDSRDNRYDEAVRTDTMMVVSVDFAAQSASMLSIPRDLWVALPELEGYNIYEGRINTAYVYGEAYKYPGGGPALAERTVSLNFGVRLNRYAVVDFEAFVKAVDALGGIDVDVPQAIYDATFPADEGFGVILFQLPAGRQHMDGATALRYARTRHQDDDFHRNQRQQLVMLAIRDRALSPEVLPRLPALAEALYGAVRTDLRLSDVASLLCIAPKIDRGAIQRYAIDGNYVQAWVTGDGAHVMIPNREALGPLIATFNGEH